MVPVHGTGSETGNGTEGTKGTGNVSGTLAGNGTGGETEAVHWTDCWFVDEGGAGSAVECMRATVGDVDGRRNHLRQPRSTEQAGLAQGEGGRTAEGSAGEEEWREEEEEGGRRGVERGES